MLFTGKVVSGTFQRTNHLFSLYFRVNFRCECHSNTYNTSRYIVQNEHNISCFVELIIELVVDFLDLTGQQKTGFLLNNLIHPWKYGTVMNIYLFDLFLQMGVRHGWGYFGGGRVPGGGHAAGGGSRNLLRQGPHAALLYGARCPLHRLELFFY